MGELTRRARLVCAAVVGIVRRRHTLLLLGVAGVALLGALLSSSWSAHGQGLDVGSVDAGSLWIDQGDAHLRSAITTNSPLNPDHAFDGVNSQPTSGQIRAAFSSVADTPPSGGLAPTQTPQPQVLVTPTYLSIAEGGSGRYWIYLRSVPSANVTIVISAGAGVTAHPTEVRFTPTAWRSPQVITVTGLDDADSNDGTATITHAVKTGSASEYLSLDVRSVQVVIQDDDDAGISTSPDRMRIAEGDSGTIDVKLEAPPTADVTVTGTVSDGTWATIEPSTLIFTSTDWNTPKPFTLTSVDDQVRNPWDERSTIRVNFASSSSDDNYDDLAGPRVSVEIADDEATVGCIRLYPDRLYIPEGGTATFTVALCSKPTAVSPSDTPYVEMTITAGGEVTTNPARIRFEGSNWASGHTVTVSAGDDDDGANDELTIRIAGASASGRLYVGTKAEVVTTVIDDDTGGIINPTNITVPEGGRSYYKAAIISEPSGTVTISISAGPEVTTNVSNLTFGYSNWETPQYVIVSAPADSVTEDVGLQLSHTIGGSSTEYAAITLPDVMVTVADSGAGPTSFARADETDGPRLSWGPPPTPLTVGLRDEVYQYEIERSVDDGVAFAFLTCVDADSTSYLDDSVDPQEAYRYRVRAVYYATDRCAALRDIELTAGTLVETSAHGVWSDGDTIWVAHDSDSKLYAYELATGAAQAADDITPHSDSNSVPPADYTDADGGLWGDATRIWTVTANHRESTSTPEEVAFIPYRKSDGVFLSSDLVLANGDMRASNYHPPGVDRARLPDAEAFFSDGSTFWAAASGRDTLFAYDAADGRRDYGKDIVVPDSVCDHDQVVGIWHDASRSLLYLATQCSTKKLFALDLSGGLANAHHIPVHDITLPNDHGTINGFWSDGDVVWVSSNTGSAATRDSLLAYPLNNNRQYSGWSSPPGVESVDVAEASITQIEATATVTVSEVNGGLVNLRYRETASSGSWETASLSVEFGVSTVDFPLSGLTADREYTVEASFDSSFPTARTKTASFRTLPPAIESVGAIETDQTTATIRAIISAPNGDSKKVHLRYRIKDETAWQATDPVDTTDDHADFPLSDLTSGTDYELEASLDDTFPTDETTTGKFATEPPSVDSVVASDETQTGANITVNVTEPNGSLVYIQYRADGTDTWKPQSAEVASGAASHEFTLMDLTSDTTYEVEASYDNTFPDTDATSSDSFTTLPPSVEFIIASDEGQTTATVTVGVVAPNGSFVHLQYRTGTDAWRTAKKAVIAEETEAVFALRGLTSDRAYEVEASYDSSFPDTDVTLSTTFTTLPPSVYSVIVGDKTKTTANAKIKIAAPNGDSQTVRLRYSPTATESWSTAEPVTSTDADATIPLSSLTAATQYKVEATLASDFTSGVRPTVFSTLGDDPIVEDVFVYDADINQEDATATIIVANAGGDAHEVHLRYRTAGETPGAWSTEDLKADTDPNDSDTATIELTSLSAGTQYDVQASLDSTFATGTRQTTFTTDRPVPEIVSVIATSDSSTEATVTVTIEHPDGSTVYVGYRTTGDTPGSWSAPVDFAADTSRHSLILSGLSPSTEYEVTAAFSTPFPATPLVSDSFSTLAFDPTLTDVSVMDITQSGPAAR